MVRRYRAQIVRFVLIGAALAGMATLVRERQRELEFRARGRLARLYERRYWDEAKGADRRRVEEALRTPESAWRFITSPDTAYADRVAAARDAKVITLDFLPVFLEARRELLREQSLHDWGLATHPLSSGGRGGRKPRAKVGSSIHRTILGHRWTVPERSVHYPITPEEKAVAPWPWQVSQVLARLRGAFTVGETPEAVFAAVMALPCTNDDEARSFLDASEYGSTGSGKTTVAIIGARRNIALNPRFDETVRFAAAQSSLGGHVRLWDDDRSFAVGHAFALDVIERGTPRQLDQMAYELDDLRTRAREHRTTRSNPVPYSAFLAWVRRIESNPDADAFDKLYCLKYLVQVLDVPPFREPGNRDRPEDKSGTAAQLAHFRSWFRAHEAELESKAAAEALQLDEARAWLDAVKKCAE